MEPEEHFRIGARVALKLRGISGTCPHCGRYVGFESLRAPAWADLDDRKDFLLAQCRRCRNLSALHVRKDPQQTDGYVVERVVPTGTVELQAAAAPSSVRSALDEALGCQSVGAVTAGALVCRRAVQLIARDRVDPAAYQQLGTNPSLAREIDALTIPAELKLTAHAVRVIANEAAHPNPFEWDFVTTDDLDDLIELVLQLVHFLYELPHRVSTFSDRVQARIEQAPAGDA